MENDKLIELLNNEDVTKVNKCESFNNLNNSDLVIDEPPVEKEDVAAELLAGKPVGGGFDMIESKVEFNGTADVAVLEGDEVGKDAKVEMHENVVAEKNVNTKIFEMEIKADKLDDTLMAADCEKKHTDICVETRMGEGRNEGVVLPTLEKDEVEEVAMEEIVRMATLEMDIKADEVIGNEDSVVHKLDDTLTDSSEPLAADCETKETDICAGTGMGEGSSEAIVVPIVDKDEVEEVTVEEIAQMTTLEMDIKADEVIGKEDSDTVTDSSEPLAADCEKKETDICAGTRMGEGSSEAIVVPIVEKNEVEEVAMEENFVDVVKEKEKQAELVESVALQYEKDEVIGGVEKNDEFKCMEGDSSVRDGKLDDEKEVCITVEEPIDSKEADLESNVSESFVDKSGKSDEVEGKEEVGAGDIKKETDDDTEANTMEITKEDELEVSGDIDAPMDSKEVDLESNVSESFVDKSGKSDEVEGKEEVGAGDIKKETDDDTEANTMEITKEDELEVSGDIDAPMDSKEVDLESNVSESFVDKSGKSDEFEGKEEVGAGDIKNETDDDMEDNTMEITKEDELKATGDIDAPQTLQDEEIVAEEETNADTEVETETDVAESGKSAGGKRKRAANRKSTPKSRKTVGEDVCFICFDGGSLVLCDHRGCPKGYHPSCVNHDDAFFGDNCRWTCGWHLCSICEKKAHYFCYTCLFSLCKGCSKDAVLLCVRGKKGFCETCMEIVKLLENSEQGVKNDQVDFDDKSCWEYLFRDYYIELKSNLSLSSAEIAEAKSPWKGLETSPGKDDKLRSGIQDNFDGKQQSPEIPGDHKYDAEVDAENSNDSEEATKPRRKKVKKRLKPRRGGQASISNEEGHVGTDWASNELLEFVMHMKSGDRSILSEYDVQALLLEYIKINNLRDPRQKSRIICDSRLHSLFGKSRVGHFEMLKLLESHFFIKEGSHTDDAQGSVVDTNSEQLEVGGNADTPKGTKEKKRKSRKKGDRRGPQFNLDDYAAIDMHNISLIYLRRKLMEDLLEDSETFEDKVLGTFVRIRTSGIAQKQDIYRLVQVVGTSNVTDPYKVGKRTTNIMVEILNLNKTEVIQIDTISNQDFTEDECKRLRQSIKCGLINRLTVGDILDKATELRTAKVNDWLETEIVRLSHLCDRASEKGRKKELRECVEKLQLLKTPEERQRRLADEIPEIHVDPKMDPTYESEEDDIDKNRQDIDTKIRGPGSRVGRGQISPVTDRVSKDPWIGGAKYASKNFELDRNMFSKNGLNKGGDNTTHSGEVQGETSWNQARGRAKPESSNLDKFGSTIGSETRTIGLNNHDAPNSESLSSSVSKQVPDLTKAAESSKINESEKNWHYKDPSGKFQGPFSMVQLRKWNNTGYFPADLKVWRTTEKQEDSILLTDALSGKFQKGDTLSAASCFGRNGGLPSPTSVTTTECQGRLSTPISGLRSSEKLQVSENEPVITGSSGVHVGLSALSNTLHISPAVNSEAHAMQVQGNVAVVQEPQTVSNQNPITGTLGWSSAQSQKVESNVAVPVQPQNQSYGQWGNMPATGYTHPGNFPQGNQPNMQLPALPNPSWAVGAPENNNVTAPAPRPENPNPNYGWGVMQGNQNMVWMGAPPNNGNTNWGAAPLQGPPSANQNIGWAMPPGNLIAAVQGQLPAGANPSWNSGTANSSVQGLPPAGNVNQSWVAPQTVNTLSNVHMPASGSGWPSTPGNPGAPVLAPLPGNGNQGISKPPGGQGSWRSDQNNSGSKFSNKRDQGSHSHGAPVLAPVPGNGNQGISKSPGGQGSWRSDQNNSGSKFSNQRDQGSRGGGHGYEGNMSRSRSSSSYGNGGAGGPWRNDERRKPCPYNQDGRCRRGASCNYLHT